MLYIGYTYTCYSNIHTIHIHAIVGRWPAQGQLDLRTAQRVMPSTCARARVCVCVCMYVCMYVHIYIYIYIYIYTHREREGCI